MTSPFITLDLHRGDADGFILKVSCAFFCSDTERSVIEIVYLFIYSPRRERERKKEESVLSLSDMWDSRLALAPRAGQKGC